LALSALTISCIANKNWDQDPTRKQVDYQRGQYVKIRRCDIDDKKALLSINSDAAAFQFRQQGQVDLDPGTQVNLKKEEKKETKAV